MGNRKLKSGSNSRSDSGFDSPKSKVNPYEYGGSYTDIDVFVESENESESGSSSEEELEKCRNKMRNFARFQALAKRRARALSGEDVRVTICSSSEVARRFRIRTGSDRASSSRYNIDSNVYF